VNTASLKICAITLRASDKSPTASDEVAVSSIAAGAISSGRAV
jgi:hypothetical protein